MTHQRLRLYYIECDLTSALDLVSLSVLRRADRSCCTFVPAMMMDHVLLSSVFVFWSSLL